MKQKVICIGVLLALVGGFDIWMHSRIVLEPHLLLAGTLIYSLAALGAAAVGAGAAFALRFVLEARQARPEASGAPVDVAVETVAPLQRGKYNTGFDWGN